MLRSAQWCATLPPARDMLRLSPRMAAILGSIQRQTGKLTRYLSAPASVAMEMPPCDVQPSKYKGKSYDDIASIRKAHINPLMQLHYKKPLLVSQGYKQWLWDHEGKRYLDLYAGIITISVGYCHPKVNERVIHQLNMIGHQSLNYLHSPMHEYAEKLVAKMPGDLKVAYFTNSGSEANDLAMLMASLHTGCSEFINIRWGRSYHGGTCTVRGLTGMDAWSFANMPSKTTVQKTMTPDPYRGPWGGSNCRDSLAQVQRECNCPEGSCQASEQYADQLEDLLECACAKRIAGFIAEPIQGANGSVQYPRNFLKRAFDSVRKRGGVCIADEVQTGFGRVGDAFWAFQTHHVMPDIVTMAKGIANGFPMGAVVTTPEIAQTMTQALHMNTYGGNPISSAAASAVLDVIEEEGLQANAKRVGDIFLKGMMELRDEFEIVGDVRGKGLMLGMELVEDKSSKRRLQPERMATLFELTKDSGVLFGRSSQGNTLRIKPPLCVTEEDAKFALHVLRTSLRQCS